MSNTTNKTRPTFALAPVSHDAATQAAKGLVKAATKAEGATRTLLGECVAAVRLVGTPLTAAQWDKQVAPAIREAFKRSKAGLAETTVASYRSRFKTAGLAILSGLPELQPVAGETFPGFLARVAEPLSKAKLADGRFIYDPATVRPGRAAGTRASKPGSATGQSVGAVNRSEGGMDERPALAAALILTGQNMARAQRLCIVMQSYPDEFDRWTSSILTDQDKRELEAATAPPAEASKPAKRKAA